MASINQREYYIKKTRKYQSAALLNKPQARGRFNRVVIVTPRKPNSALRKVGKVSLYNSKKVIVKIPGSGMLPQKYAVVIVKGKGHRDTPGVKYSLIRGAGECIPIFTKYLRRSIYGVPKNPKIYKSRRSR